MQNKDDDERWIAAARIRLQAAGYPADDLSDEDVLAGRRVWWGREADWATVARECPEIAGAIVRWANDRPLPTNLEVYARTGLDPEVIVSLRTPVGGRQRGYHVLLAANMWNHMWNRWRLGPQILEEWVWFELDQALAVHTRNLRVQQHEAMHAFPAGGNPDDHISYQPPRMP